MTDALGDAVGDATALGDGETDAAADPDALADPLGAGVAIDVWLGVGEGKSELGMFASDRANVSMKMASTMTTQMRARLSSRGGSEPR